MASEIDLLFATRFHGAVNIRGVRYQILYSLLRAFELYQPGAQATWIRLEGIEDVDLRGLRLSDEYVQVKTADKPWTWGRLKKPLAGLLAVHRVDPNAKLTLAVNFALRDDFAGLSDFHSLPLREQERLEAKLIELCRQLGASPNEARGLRAHLVVVSLPEEVLWQQLRSAAATAFGLGSSAVDTYLLALVARFLEWATGRKVVTRNDLDAVRLAVGEALAREAEFQAYGRGLIDRISWEPDASPDDFFSGKGTRPGHIRAGLDAPRPHWIQLIDKAVKAAKVCVLRTSSGQGKSALLYRYAHDSWPPDNILALKVAEIPEHVQVIRSYLELRAQLGQPLLILVDNAGLRTRLWSEVAAECVRFGFRVLVSVREEDWFRFAIESVTSYEVLEPDLDLAEARLIFRAFRSAGRLHPTIDSAEWAYERVGEPHLLLEYVYLITKGHMLEERLREQERQFTEQGEDPAKSEILRRVALAHVLGATLDVDSLVGQVHLNEDAGRIFRSLTGEYIRTTQERVSGLHWVRSDHLVRILHEGYPSQTRTAVGCLGAIPQPDIASFVSNALSRSEIDSNAFRRGLEEWAGEGDLGAYLAVLEGLFDAGERQFFRSNQQVFDEVFSRGGRSLLFLVSSAVLPTVQVDALGTVIEVLKDRGQPLRDIQERLLAGSGAPRGIDGVRSFLDSTLPPLGENQRVLRLRDIGRLLDWCALAGSQISGWRHMRDRLVTESEFANGDSADVVTFAQGLYRYDPEAYGAWLATRRDELIDYLRLALDCLDIEVTDEAVDVSFFVEEHGTKSPNDQAVSRLRILHSAFPFADRYRSRGVWLLPFGLSPSVDDTRKDMPRENLPFESDVAKNVTWRKSVESNYSIDGFYDYQRTWHEVRMSALAIVRRISQSLRRLRSPSSPFNVMTSSDRVRLFTEFEEAFKRLPAPPSQTPSQVIELFEKGASTWASSLHTFILQSVRFSLHESGSPAGSLVLHNFREAQTQLAVMHESFSALFEISPDYFDSASLNAAELKEYGILSDLLEAWLVEPPRLPESDMLRYARERRQSKERELIHQVERALISLTSEGNHFLLPTRLVHKHPLTFFPLGFSVSNVCRPIEHLEDLLRALSPVAEVATFFWLVPMHRGVRLGDVGYRIGASNMAEIADGQSERWESLVPIEILAEVLEALSNPSVIAMKGPQIRSEIDALVASIDACAAGERQLSLYKRSWGPRADEHAARYESRFRGYRNDLVLLAAKLETQIRSGVGGDETDDERNTLLAFLQTLQSNVKENPLGAIPLPAEDLVNHVLSSAERLLCHSHE